MLKLRMFFVVWLAQLIGVTCAVAQPMNDASVREEEMPAPRGNEEFFNVRVSGRVARRFEMYSPHSVEALRELKDMGITQVILDWPNLHADATALGLDVVLSNWWNDKTAEAEIERVFEFAKSIDPKHLRGISVMDEPERNSPDTPFGFYVDLYEKHQPRIAKSLPGVRLEISHWGPLARWDQRYYDYFSFLYEAADVMRIMPYPDLHEGPLSEVALMILRSREVMKTAERELPLVVILQTWVLPPRNELPTLPELRVMAYQALLGGAETVSFFDHNPQVWNATQGFTAGFRDLMRELTAASARWKDATVVWHLQADGIFIAELTFPGGAQSTVRLNTSRTAAGGLDALEIREERQPPAQLSPAIRSTPAVCPCPPLQRRIIQREAVRPRRPLQRLFPRLHSGR